MEPPVPFRRRMLVDRVLPRGPTWKVEAADLEQFASSQALLIIMSIYGKSLETIFTKKHAYRFRPSQIDYDDVLGRQGRSILQTFGCLPTVALETFGRAGATPLRLG